MIYMKEEINKLESSSFNQNFWYTYKTMLSYYLKCSKNVESKNQKIVKTKNGRTMLFSKFAICDGKILKLIWEQEPSRLLSSLGMKALFSENPLVVLFLFYTY